MARRDIKEEFDCHQKGEKSIIVQFDNSSDFNWICFQGFPIRKSFTIKTRQFGNEVSEVL